MYPLALTANAINHALINLLVPYIHYQFPNNEVYEHHSLHHAPILTAGVPTPAILLEFEDACEDFFANAKGGVADEAKVTLILPGFKDPIIRGWISSDRAHLST